MGEGIKGLMDKLTRQFADRAVFDATEKTALSVRDGVLEYLGAELGLEPEDKVFRVYRSSATISNTAMKMRGLPITDDHVSLDVPAPSHGGFVSDAEMVDVSDEALAARIAIKNQLAISDTLLAKVQTGKRELSLGYQADLIPYEGEGGYDFEQRNIMPHHLAVVDQGRCGGMCSFLDRKPEPPAPAPAPKETDMSKLHKAFCDAEGAMNLQQIVELAAALPEAIKAVPVDKLNDLMPALKEIVDVARGVMGAEDDGAEPVSDEKEDYDDEEKAMSEEEKEKEFSDAVAKAADEKAKAITDAAIKRHGEVIEKARHFLVDDYQFTDKSTAQIMRDAVATESSDEFTDAELPLAFKMLKKSNANYKDFGDKQPGSLAALADKEL